MNRHTIALSLFALLCSIYFLTYFGDRTSNDGNYIFDSTESFVKRGQFDITIHYDLLGAASPEDGSPLPASQQEPLQPILAAPLYWLAQQAPTIGLAHTVWLFNIFVTAGTAVMLFYMVLHQGYTLKIALLTAIIFGLATAAWPYTRTFFREPLAGLWLLLITWHISAFSSDQHSLVKLRILILTSVFIILLVLTKSIIAIAVLPLILIALPQKRRHTIRIFFAFIALIILIALVGNLLNIQRFQITFIRNLFEQITWQYMVESLLGYTVSPGRSIVLFSPVLLLSVVGGAMLYRNRQWRIPTAILLGTLLVILSYGFRGAIWWGGNSWGARHTLPLIPVLMLLVPPALSAISQNRRLIVGTASLIIMSLGIQLLGVLVSIYTHYGNLAANNITVWEGGIWQWQWSPIPQHITLFDVNRLDVAWHIGTDQGLMVVIITMIASGIAAISLWRQKNLMLAGAACLSLPIIFGIGLSQLKKDPRYILGNTDALALVEAIEDHVAADDLILVQATTFSRTLMNAYKGNATFISLPYIPGENFDPTVNDPAWRTMPPNDLLGDSTVFVLNWAKSNYETIWTVLDAVPGAPNELRVLERTMYERFYPIERIEINPTARLNSYAVAEGLTERPNDIVFNPGLAIPYYVSPRQETLTPGDVLMLRLYWRTETPLDRDYLLSVQLAPVGAPPIVQRDGPPQDGLGRTSTWEPDTLYPDNHALKIPMDAPPGEYQVQIVVYTYPELERLTTIDGDDVAILRQLTVSE
jgi:hypothetical protein